MENGLDILVVRGFAVPEGRGKWACCYEIRLTTGRDEPLLYRGELHGRRYACEAAAIAAATWVPSSTGSRSVASGKPEKLFCMPGATPWLWAGNVRRFGSR